MSRFDVQKAIEKLDPVRDHERIMQLSTCYDFPWDTTRALEFALFRTFCVPSISELLHRTGEFTNRARKRYDDTDLIISEMVENGYTSERGKRALRRMNQLHGRFDISNDDFLYVLSTFIYEPIRWNARFGWRPLSAVERRAYFEFWREVGRRMAIKDIPADPDVFERFNRDYEARHYRYTEANHQVGVATRELFVSWFPWAPKSLVRTLIYAMMDDPLLDAFGFPRPPTWLRRVTELALRLRGLALRFFPTRKTPRRRTEMRRPTYPEGYVVESLGPP